MPAGFRVPASNTGGASNFSELAGTAAVNQGGTGATTASGARTNLGAQEQSDNLDELGDLTLVKGDIFTTDGSTLNKLGVGSNDQVLTADSAQTNGVKWADASGLSNASDITNGIQVEGADSADNLKITVDASGDATLAPTGAEIALAPAGGSTSTRRVNILQNGHYFGNASSWLGIYSPTGGQQFFIGGSSVFYTSITGIHMSNGKWIHRTASSGLTASTTQSQGQGPLTSQVNEISVCANPNDVRTLPSAVTVWSLEVVVINNGAETLQIYPASGDAINGQAVNASVTVASGETAIFISYDSTNWVKK